MSYLPLTLSGTETVDLNSYQLYVKDNDKNVFYFTETGFAGYANGNKILESTGQGGLYLQSAFDANKRTIYTYGGVYKAYDSPLYITNNFNSIRFTTPHGITFDDSVFITEFSTDGTLSDNSDFAVPTEKAIKTYIATTSGSLQRQIDTSKIEFDPTPNNEEASGDIASMVVDSNSIGVGAALYIASDNNLEEASATSSGTMPCFALALEPGTGAKKILLKGFIRNNNWNWLPGKPVYVSDKIPGTLIQTTPSQTIGIATQPDTIFFNPSYTFTTTSSGLAAAPWLSDWANRIKITIDNIQVDSDLVHYPLPIHINSSAGPGQRDLTDIFDEITTNSLKIAVTKSDGITQMYVEIDEWDYSSESALLWVSKSNWTISSSDDTDIYIYYDSSQSDNSTYVGSVGSRSEVWDNYFRGVWHLDTSLKDSTTILDMTNIDTTDVVGVLGRGRSGAGDNDWINMDGFDQDVKDDTVGTISMWAIKPTAIGENELFCVSRDGSSTASELFLSHEGSSFNKISVIVAKDGTRVLHASMNIAGTYNTWQHITVTQDATAPEWFLDGQSKTVTYAYETDKTAWFKACCTDATNKADTAALFTLKRNGSAIAPFVGTIDELRVSSVARSAAWIKMDYNSQIDNVLTFGQIETY